MELSVGTFTDCATGKPPEDAVEYVAEDDDMEWLDNCVL